MGLMINKSGDFSIKTNILFDPCDVQLDPYSSFLSSLSAPLHLPVFPTFHQHTMSTTPKNMSPKREFRTPDRAGMDQSMMVEPPSHIEDSAQTPQESTVRLNIQDQQQQRLVRSQTPETQKRRSDRSEVASPGQLAPFGWEEFDVRYEKALREADEDERQMLEEFEQLVKYFNVWASASSVHDNERAVKRLKTRERYVCLAEQSLSQKKQHLGEVVKAFQSALALLNSPS
ncbi:hypothetical protein F5Y17DRAFT_415568 [Xylariaceae sp. FL0594]|nr:hypothetical protein F5Y17DRAFT_415568 [Xylariaceae sp. FL0594]